MSAIPTDVRRMLSLLRPERKHYALGLLSLLVVNLADVAGPLFIALAVDIVASHWGAVGPVAVHAGAVTIAQTQQVTGPFIAGARRSAIPHRPGGWVSCDATSIDVTYAKRALRLSVALLCRAG